MIFLFIYLACRILAADVNFGFNQAIKDERSEAVIEMLNSSDIELDWIPSRFSGYRPHLIEAVVRNRFNIAQLLLDKGCDPNICYSDDQGRIKWQPISFAIERQNIKMIVLLAQYHLDIDVVWWTDGVLGSPWKGPQIRNPNVIRAYYDRCVRALSSGVDPNYRFSDDHLSFIDKFALYGTTDMITELMALGANPDLYDNGNLVPPTIVLLAQFRAGDIYSKISALVKAGANVNGRLRLHPDNPGRIKEGRSALWYAVEFVDHHLVRTLLDLGAIVKLQPRWGNSILYDACHKGHLPIVSEILLRHLRSGQNIASLMKERNYQSKGCFKEMYQTVLNTLPRHWVLLRMLFLLGSGYEAEKQVLEFRYCVKKWHVEAGLIRTNVVLFTLSTECFLPKELRRIILTSLFLEFMYNRVYGL